MIKIIVGLLSVIIFSCSTTSYYIVRHAEKEAQASNMSSDVDLSPAGKERAKALKEVLKKEKINFITSTPTKRTMATAEPLSNSIGKNTHVYDLRDTVLLNRYKNSPDGNMLFVGHSNTVDDIVNFLMGRHVLQDLPDTAYGDLFIVKKKRGAFSFDRRRFGK